MVPVAPRGIDPHRRRRMQVQHGVHDVAALRQHIAAALHGIVGPELRRPVVVNDVRHGERRVLQIGLGREHGRKKPQLEARGREHAAALDRGHDAIAVRQGQCEGFLQKEVLARRRRGLGQGRMRVVLGADPDGIDGRVRPDPRRVRGGVTGAEFLRERLRPVGGDVGDGVQFHLRAGGKKLGMLGTVAAASDDGDVENTGGTHGGKVHRY